MEGDRAIGKPAPPGPTSAREGEMLGAGRYRIEGLVGRGGAGTVYSAYDTACDRRVALKRLDAPGTAGSESARGGDGLRQARRRAQQIRLFQREYHTLAQLAHPRIIEVYDYGVDDDAPFYTMELLQGDDLAKAAPLPWRRACEVLRDVASALTLLHSRRLLHRDIAPRNVHCGREGPAKLIDFGAMSAVGPTDLLVGTPAFVPPEAVQRQALDARSDLYSLGALGYFLLTGRAPYPARTFADLRDAQRSHPSPPSTNVQDVPRQLDALVMGLLAMDRGARPSSAVELVERLTALAGLEHDPRLAVASAYLSTPALVGREREVVAVRRRALRALRGRGASVLVSGAPGVGRSRLLDACALEGKLAGALVLRGAPGAAGGVDFGVVRSLLLQLHASLGDADRRAFELPARLQAQLVPGLIWTRANSKPISMRPAAPIEDRTVLPDALHDYLVHLASRRSLMFVIDDFHAIDEPSAAVIARLAVVASQSRLVIAAAYAPQAPIQTEAALRVLREYSRALPLEPLAAHESEALLRSVFGAVPNLALVADRLHALSAGKPRPFMELAQHLVDGGVIRYQTGGFVLPEALAASDLPESLDAALQARCERLPRAARQLGAVVALCAGAPLTLEQGLSLIDPSERAACERALDELVASQMIAIEDDHVMLRQGGFAGALLADASADQIRQLHARIAELFASDPALHVRAAEHHFLAGKLAAGLDLLRPIAEEANLSYDGSPTYHALIDTALTACGLLGRPPRDAFMLRRARMYHDLHYFERCERAGLLAFAGELYGMSGLAHWDAQADEPDSQLRLTRALQLAAVAYERTPERERIYSPREAIPELAKYLAAVAGHACAAFDLELLEELPSMAAYAALSPAIEVMDGVVSGMRDLRASRHDMYRARMQQVLARLDGPGELGLPPEQYLVVRLSISYSIAVTNAALGYRKVFEQADELEALPSMRTAAWRVRYLAHLHRGDLLQADHCRRQLELLLIQQGSRQAHAGTTLEVEFMCYACSDDLINLRRLLPELSAMAGKHPGWQPLLLLAQAELERVRGRLDSALALYGRVMALAKPGRHMMWPYAAAFSVQVLVDLGRAHEAKALGDSYLEICEQHQMGALNHNLIASLAHAEAALGDYDGAIARTDEMIRIIEDQEVHGMFAGLRYELRARLALLVRDAPGFARNVERCREHYGCAADSPFTPKLVRLLGEARRAGLELDASAQLPDAVIAQAASRRLQRELAACTTLHERAERALALLIETSGAESGHLYGMQNGRLALLATSAAGDADEHLSSALERFVAGLEHADDELTAVVEVSEEPVPSLTELRGSDGRVYTPFAVCAEREAGRVAAAVALAFGPLGWRAPSRDLLAAIGEELLARGDVSAFTTMR